MSVDIGVAADLRQEAGIHARRIVVMEGTDGSRSLGRTCGGSSPDGGRGDSEALRNPSDEASQVRADVVTEADLASEERIMVVLRAADPAFGLVSEEAGAENPDAEVCLEYRSP